MRWVVRIWAWMKMRFGLGQVSSKMTDLEAKIDRLVKERDSNDRALEAHLQTIAKAKAEVEKAYQLNKKLNLALETALEEIENAKSITIPGLVAANKTLISRWEAEVQIHAIRSSSLATGGAEGSIE